jgi:hypothetical protein
MSDGESNCWYVKKIVTTITQGTACAANSIPDRELIFTVSDAEAKAQFDCNAGGQQAEAKRVANKAPASKRRKK